MSTAPPRARSLAWLERPADNRKVASPNLAGPTSGRGNSESPLVTPCVYKTDDKARGSAYFEPTESLNWAQRIGLSMLRMRRGSAVAIIAVLGIVIVAAVLRQSSA